MCAAVAAIPVVATLPATDLSVPNVSVPLPFALVATGGTSWSPDSVTFTSVPKTVKDTAIGAMKPIARPSFCASERFLFVVFTEMCLPSRRW